MATTDPPHAPAQPAVHPAGVGSRIAAGVIDALVLGIVFGVFSAAFGKADAGDGTVSASLTGAPFILYLLVVLGYYFVLENALGRTLGKMALGLRVVRLEGGKPTSGSIVARTLLRIIDGLPFLYLVGIVTILVTGGERRQRLGDIAGGTTVVKG